MILYDKKLNTPDTNPDQTAVLYTIQTVTDPLIALLADDPVRPQIPADFRVGEHSEIFVLLDSAGAPGAVLCVAYQHQIPASVDQLLLGTLLTSSAPDVAVFYTIWSYGSGAGRQLISLAMERIRSVRAGIQVFVTLSPTTEMARKFHIRNGACEYRHNADSVNYLYLDLRTGSVADCATDPQGH